MLNPNLLRAAIAKQGLNQRKLAEKMGISENTLTSRIQGRSVFNTDEIDIICDVLKISDNAEKAEIFLASPSQIWEDTNAS